MKLFYSMIIICWYTIKWFQVTNNNYKKTIIVSRFGLVLWHINYCWLFNAISSLYIYIKYIGFGLVWFGLVWFHGISTIVGYLIPNPLYTHILII